MYLDTLGEQKLRKIDILFWSKKLKSLAQWGSINQKLRKLERHMRFYSIIFKKAWTIRLRFMGFILISDPIAATSFGIMFVHESRML